MLILLFLLILILLLYQNYIHNPVNLDVDVLKVTRPFVNMYDNNGNRLNVILISKPFGIYTERDNITLNKLNKNNIIIGITSYAEFPNMVTNPYDDFTNDYKINKYHDICEAWLYCFKNPQDYFKPNIPKLLLSESDFIDSHNYYPDKNIKKKYDFIYICLKQDESKNICDDWATHNKNWEYAKKCIDIMCNIFKLKGLLVGRKGCYEHNLITTTNRLSKKELKKCYNQSKFIFIPNEKDASPRILAEALLHNIPCLINEKIIGGWKYINNKTGMFFKNEKDLILKLDSFLNLLLTYTPREYFINNYGPIKSGILLKEFIFTHFKNRLNKDYNEVKYLTLGRPYSDNNDLSLY